MEPFDGGAQLVQEGISAVALVVCRRFARAGCGVVLVDSRGVDARHDAVGVAAEAPQLLWGQDVDDE